MIPQSSQSPEMLDTIVMPNQKVALSAREEKKSRFSMRFPSFFKRKSKVMVSKEPRKKGLRKWQVGALVALVILLTIGGAVGAIGFYTYQVAMNLKQQALETKASASLIKDQFKSQDLKAVDATLLDIQAKVENMKKEYQKLAFYKSIPIASAYYKDGEHAFAAGDAGVKAGLKSVDALIPYADVLGFSGEGSFTGGTAEDRIRLLLDTLSKVTPVIDDITNDLKVVESELAQIDANRYPEQIQGTALRSQIVSGQAAAKAAVAGVTEFRPAIEVLPEVAGSEERRKYLLIFQNDNELRPTGGFMTAYAVMFVEDGKVIPEKSDDIYELDKKATKKQPIPPILGRYLTTEKNFNLRDMNISPDFKVSMDTFYENYSQVRGEPTDIDGIVAVDTDLLSEMVRILGPVEVPGYGTFSAENDARCDCPQIIYALSEIVDRPTPYIREDRKGIIAPMMQAILQKAYTAPKEKWPELFTLAQKKIEEKHVQMYFFDEKYQKAAEQVNVAGRMANIKPGHDHLAIVDANLGGAKSNLFVVQEVDQKVSAVENGMITKTLTIKYKNPHPGSNCNLEAGQLCLNATLRDWVRVYLPKGAKITGTNGFDEGTMQETDDKDLPEFKVVEGVFKVAPLANGSIVINYTVPYENTKEYNLQVRKQAGTDNVKYFLDVDGHQEEVILDKDKVITIPY